MLNKGNLKINGYRFMQTLAATDKNVLIILDAYVPTRFWAKRGLRRDLLCRNGFEVISAGYPGQDIDGQQFAENPFTEVVADRFNDIRGKAMNGKLKRKAPFSINDLLKDAELHSNPVRIWLSHTSPEYEKRKEDERPKLKDKVVPRFKMDPEYIRQNEQIAFTKYIILDTQKDKARKRTLEEMYVIDCL